MSKVVNLIDQLVSLSGGELVEFMDRTGLSAEQTMQIIRTTNRVGFVYRIVKDASESNRRIQAIKVYREITGEPIWESKDVVDGNRDIPTHFNLDVHLIEEGLKYSDTGYKVVKSYKGAYVE